MSNENKAFIAGLIIGCLVMNLVWLTVDFTRDFPGTKARAAIEKCEAGLQRNQICVITAKPKE